MGIEFLLSWQSITMFILVILLSVAILSIFNHVRIKQLGWRRLVRGYTFALMAMSFVLLVQSGFQFQKLIGESVLGCYFVLPWITYCILPLALLKARDTVVSLYILGAATLITALAAVFLWPKSEGYEFHLVLKNSAISVFDLFILLIMTALVFQFGVKNEWAGSIVKKLGSD